uniref:Uncharacterized protein n=1 Tax=Schizaphis graminum TaxID=13262 RepID=A0A2S2N7F9_SCHGA
MFEAQERLDAIQLGHGVGDEPVAVDHKQLVSGEHVQPPVNVVMVSGHGHRPVVCVNRAVRLHHQLLERPAAAVRQGVAVQLRVIRYGPDHRIPEDEQQLNARIHRLDAFRYLWCHEIAGTLFNGDLVGERVRHPPSVPIQATFVVVVPVEEMHLAVGLLHRLVQEQHLQQRPRAAFPHTDDDRLRQSSAGLRKPESPVRSIVLSRSGGTGRVLVVDHFVQSLQRPAVGASVNVQAAQQEQHSHAQYQLGPLDIRNTPSSHYDLHIWRIVPGGAIIAVWWRNGGGVGAPGGRLAADPAVARTQGTGPASGQVVRRGGDGWWSWGERSTSVGGGGSGGVVSRLFGVRVAAASAVEVGYRRGGGGGAGLGRASRLNVLNGCRRRRRRRL